MKKLLAILLTCLITLSCSTKSLVEGKDFKTLNQVGVFLKEKKKSNENALYIYSSTNSFAQNKKHLTQFLGADWTYVDPKQELKDFMHKFYKMTGQGGLEDIGEFHSEKMQKKVVIIQAKIKGINGTSVSIGVKSL